MSKPVKAIKSLDDLKGFVRYDGDGLQAIISDLTGLDCSADEPAQQQFKDECDINQIMARYQRTEVMDLRSNFQSGVYADLASMPDYLEAQTIVANAQSAFHDLPAEIRVKFDNDPARFLQFVEDPKNADRFEEYGLTKPKEAPKEPPKADATPPAEPKDAATGA